MLDEHRLTVRQIARYLPVVPDNLSGRTVERDQTLLYRVAVHHMDNAHRLQLIAVLVYESTVIVKLARSLAHLHQPFVRHLGCHSNRAQQHKGANDPQGARRDQIHRLAS